MYLGVSTSWRRRRLQEFTSIFVEKCLKTVTRRVFAVTEHESSIEKDLKYTRVSIQPDLCHLRKLFKHEVGMTENCVSGGFLESRYTKMTLKKKKNLLKSPTYIGFWGC